MKEEKAQLQKKELAGKRLAKKTIIDGFSLTKIKDYTELPIETIIELQKEFNQENSDKGNDSES